MRRLLALTLAVAVPASGCGVLFTRGRPDRVAPQAPPDCTTSKTAVYADGVVGMGAVGTSLFLGIVALGKEASLADGQRNDLAYATLYTFLVGVAFTVSGLIGGARVRGCRKAHDEWRALQAPPGSAPPAYPPPGGPPSAYPPAVPAR